MPEKTEMKALFNKKQKGEIANGEMYFTCSFNSGRKVSKEHLEMIFKYVGLKHGFPDVEVEFAPFNDMKANWQRSMFWVSIKVSDYLDTAPDSVLEELAETLFLTMRGNSNNDYSANFLKYVDSPKFRKKKRKEFIQRKGFSSAEGDVFDLGESLNRLIGAGLVPQDLDAEVGWYSLEPEKSSGCSLFFRVVWVNRRLDKPSVPEYVIDYALYSAMCHVILGYGNRRDDRLLDNKRSEYPRRAEAEGWLEANGFSLW